MDKTKISNAVINRRRIIEERNKWNEEHGTEYTTFQFLTKVLNYSEEDAAEIKNIINKKKVK